MLPLTVLSLSLLAGEARADLIDPAEAACGAAGEACEIHGEKGVCKAETCSRLDYGNMADGTPGTEQYECVRCIPGEKAAEPAPEPAADDGDVKADEAPKGGPEPKTDPTPTTTTKGTRCAVDPANTSMLSFVLGLGLLGLATRRRR